MVRTAVFILLLANAGYYVWSQGLLAAYGLAPATDSEPQRLEQQIKPELVQVLPSRSGASKVPSASTVPAAAPAPAPAAAASAPAVAAAPVAPTECLSAGLFDAARSSSLAAALRAGLPAGSWTLEETVEPGRWLVYMGRYPNTDWVERKKAELRGMHVKYEAAPRGLEPGLSLGGFDSEAAAEKMLGDVTQRGVRTARVIVEHPEVRGMQLRLPAVDAALKTQLDGLKPALGGKALHACDLQAKAP